MLLQEQAFYNSTTIDEVGSRPLFLALYGVAENFLLESYNDVIETRAKKAPESWSPFDSSIEALFSYGSSKRKLPTG